MARPPYDSEVADAWDESVPRPLTPQPQPLMPRRRPAARTIAVVSALALSATALALSATALVAGIAHDRAAAPRHPTGNGPVVSGPGAPGPAGSPTALAGAVPGVAGLPGDTAGTAPPAPPAVVAALSGLLRRRTEAVRDRDAAAWLREIDPAASGFRARQRRTFAALRELPIASWSADYDGVGPPLTDARAAVLPAGAFVARVHLAYRLRGIDSRAVDRTLYLTVVPRGAGWLLADDVDGGAAAAVGLRDLWDLDTIRISRSSAGLVIGTLDHSDAQLARFARELRRAVVAVRQVWTDPWPGQVLLVVPRDERQLAVLVDRPATGLDQIAALTTGDVTSSGQVSGDRVVLNPTTFPSLGSLARSVVLAHEVTHVATRALGRSAAPIWLTEGLADYIGYRGSGVPVAVAAGDLFAQVRAG